MKSWSFFTLAFAVSQQSVALGVDIEPNPSACGQWEISQQDRICETSLSIGVRDLLASRGVCTRGYLHNHHAHLSSIIMPQ
jgi:hypothetical protein